MPGGECLGESETLTRFPSPVNSIRLTDTAALARSISDQATHRAPLNAIAPTRKRVSVSGMTLARFFGGKIVERWVNWDALGLLQQFEVVAVLFQPRALRRESSISRTAATTVTCRIPRSSRGKPRHPVPHPKPRLSVLWLKEARAER